MDKETIDQTVQTYTKLQWAIDALSATSLTSEQSALLVIIVRYVGELLTTANMSAASARTMNTNLLNQLRLVQNMCMKPPTNTVQ